MKQKEANDQTRRACRWLLAVVAPLACVGLGGGLASCDDFLYGESDQVIFVDDHELDSDADTLWSVSGIMNKLQVLADRTILLGEMRGDLVSPTQYASADLRQLSLFTVDGSNKYNQPRDYYAVINNCNFFIARADTARERHAEGLERRDAVADAIFVLVGRGKKGAYHQSETPHLDKARAHGEVQPGADQEYDPGRTPDDVIDDRNNLLYHSIFGLLLQI